MILNYLYNTKLTACKAVSLKDCKVMDIKIQCKLFQKIFSFKELRMRKAEGKAIKKFTLGGLVFLIDGFYTLIDTLLAVVAACQ